ncbi:MAG: 23S rRNA (uracil(1939)-C(5))-methyltransferase RlmD [Clostridia bacterium]|nr:23S rRNA (uracil(1939)-C(5))-methyltransferase RlmD [Clostridia bacterium]
MVEITDIASSGMGVCRVNGKVVFVPGVIVGEKVDVEIVDEQSGYATGRAKTIANISPHRRTPPCRFFEKCGGCNLMHISYEEQLRVKEEIVKSAVSRIGNQSCEIDGIIPAKNEFAYRNKAAFPVKDGKIGYFEQGTHNIVEINSCPLLNDIMNKILTEIRPLIKNNSSLCHIVIRTCGKETMVTLVTKERQYTIEQEILDVLKSLEVDSVNINYNQNPKVILGEHTENVYGKEAVTYSVMGNEFAVSPTAFLQINTAQTETLYKKALSLVDLNGRVVLDAYCGIGTISLAIAKEAKQVIGIEINGKAVENAKEAAKANGIENAEFVCGKCESVIPQLLENMQEPPIIFFDPPRSGLDKKVITAVTASNINEIVYISCNPATLARDIKLFAEKGFAVQSVTPVDMFPNTGHVEVVSLLSRIEGTPREA